MYRKVLAALALTAAVARAEFLLYTVGENQIIDIGGGFQQDSIMIFPLDSPPSCEDVTKGRKLLPGPENDASRGGPSGPYSHEQNANSRLGYSCDGCYSPQTDVPIEAWDITRLEMYNGEDYPFFDQATGSISKLLCPWQLQPLITIDQPSTRTEAMLWLQKMKRYGANVRRSRSVLIPLCVPPLTVVYLECRSSDAMAICRPPHCN